MFCAKYNTWQTFNIRNDKKYKQKSNPKQKIWDFVDNKQKNVVMTYFIILM